LPDAEIKIVELYRDLRQKLASTQSQLQEVRAVLENHYGPKSVLVEKALETSSSVNRLTYELELQAFREIHARPPKRPRLKKVAGA
jgi:hypothetical protein